MHIIWTLTFESTPIWWYNTTCFAYLLRSLSSYGAICFQSNLSRGDTDDTDEDERDAAPRRRRRSPSAARTTNGNHLHPVDRFYHDKVQVSGKRDSRAPCTSVKPSEPTYEGRSCSIQSLSLPISMTSRRWALPTVNALPGLLQNSDTIIVYLNSEGYVT